MTGAPVQGEISAAILAAVFFTARMAAVRLLARRGRLPEPYDWPVWVWRARLALRRPGRDTMAVRPRVPRVPVQRGERW